MGNQPVWSVCIVLLLVSKTHRCLMPKCGRMVGMLFLDLVEPVSFLIHFMWPFCTSLDSKKCLETAVAVRQGNVVRLLSYIVESRVAFVGSPRVACR